jgi:hypothetical protein
MIMKLVRVKVQRRDEAGNFHWEEHRFAFEDKEKERFMALYDPQTCIPVETTDLKVVDATEALDKVLTLSSTVVGFSTVR